MRPAAGKWHRSLSSIPTQITFKMAIINRHTTHPSVHHWYRFPASGCGRSLSLGGARTTFRPAVNPPSSPGLYLLTTNIDESISCGRHHQWCAVASGNPQRQSSGTSGSFQGDSDIAPATRTVSRSSRLPSEPVHRRPYPGQPSS